MLSTANVINSFNSQNMKEFLKIKDLVLNKAYLISKAYRTTTKYGESVVLQLKDGHLFLPKRYNALEDDILEKISEGAFSLTRVLLDEGGTNFKLELSEAFNNTYFSSY